VTGTELSDPNPHVPDHDGGEARDVTMPLGQGDFAREPGLDPLAGAGSRRKLGGGGLLILAVVLIAIAGLFSMRKLAQVTAANPLSSDAEKTIEEFINSVTGGGSAADGQIDIPDMANVEQVLTVLSEHDQYTTIQVPWDQVQKNPFIIDQAVSAIITDPAAVTPNDRTGEIRAQIRQAGRSLRLKSIVAGAVPLAIIEGRIVGVDDTFTAASSDITFTVLAISSSAVELAGQAPGCDLTEPITLTLTQDDGPAARGARGGTRGQVRSR